MQTERKKILIADDDRLFVMKLRKILAAAGYTVLHAYNGLDAIQRFQKFGADLVIVDLVMPNQGGYETIRQLRQGAPGVKIIAASGVSKQHYFDIAEFLGANASMRKAEECDSLPEQEWLDLVGSLLGNEKQAGGGTE